MIAIAKTDVPDTEEAIQSMILEFLPAGYIRLSVMGDSGEVQIHEGRPRSGGELEVGAIGSSGLLVTRNQKLNVQMREG